MELHRQDPQGADIVGIDAERLLAEKVSRIGFLADKSAFLHGRKTLESQILGVGIRRRCPFETGGLGPVELHLHRPRQMDDDLVLHLQQIGAGGVELLGPDMGAAVGVDELGVDSGLGADKLHRALQHIAHAQVLADRLGVDRLALVGEGRVARDHELAGDGAGDTCEAGGQFIGERVDEVILRRIAAKIGEGQHHDRKTRGLSRLCAFAREDKPTARRRQKEKGGDGRPEQDQAALFGGRRFRLIGCRLRRLYGLGLQQIVFRTSSRPRIVQRILTGRLAVPGRRNGHREPLAGQRALRQTVEAITLARHSDDELWLFRIGLDLAPQLPDHHVDAAIEWLEAPVG